MDLENNNQKVATLSHFFIRLGKYTLFAFLLVTVFLAIGTFGYLFIAQLSWIDSFHMACRILNGMGPIAEMKYVSAKVFSSFFALYSGVAFLSITAVFFAPIIHRLLHMLHAENEEK